MMKRSPRPLIAPLALAFAAGSAAAIGAGHSNHARVYTLAAVQVGLARSPAAWVGRTILVRGIAVAGEPVDYPSPSLLDADAAAAVDPLPLARSGPDPLRGFLRRLPWLGGLAPGAQALRWGEVAVYRVQLRVQAHAHGGTGVCYEAVLLDAAPDSLCGGIGGTSAPARMPVYPKRHADIERHCPHPC